MWRPAFTSLQISISTKAHVKIMAVRVVRVECKLSISICAVCTCFHEWSRSSHHFKKSIQQNEPSLKCLQEKRISSTFHSVKLWLHWSNAHLSLKTSTRHEWCCYIFHFRFHFQQPQQSIPHLRLVCITFYSTSLVNFNEMKQMRFTSRFTCRYLFPSEMLQWILLVFLLPNNNYGKLVWDRMQTVAKIDAINQFVSQFTIPLILTLCIDKILQSRD